ncbi:hypothetical protein AB6N24_00160 [Cellulomonas sp. 179-A 4D5 NHS]|uniref:hypothetical protein n=1 Tax=Cellulomonas sp. 179-A 4D5 NHS TaxID=3142378 RepID=UPI0039A32C45
MTPERGRTPGGDAVLLGDSVLDNGVDDTRLTEPSHAVVRGALALFNDVLTRAAYARGVAVLDLRLVCAEDADFANPIEPSAHGGRKIARTIAAWLEPGRGATRSTVVT